MAKLDSYKYQKLFFGTSSQPVCSNFLAGELFVSIAPGAEPGGASADAVFPSALRQSASVEAVRSFAQHR